MKTFDNIGKNEIMLEMNDISKKFPGVQALDNVNFSVNRGEIMGLVGENGAGKSTLIKILSGFYSKDSGSIKIDRNDVLIRNVQDSLKLGISVIYQEFSLIPTLTVAENIFLGVERDVTGSKFFFSNKQLINKSKKIMSSIGIDIDPRIRIEELSRADQQLVEIAKGFRMGKKIYILDEPTSSLAEKEVENLYKVIQNVKKLGFSIIFITHRLNEILRICDRVTIIKDGKNIGVYKISEIDEHKISELMISEKLTKIINIHVSQKRKELIDYKSNKPYLQLKKFTMDNLFKNIELDLYEGEVLGIGGLLGSGRTELFKSLIGLIKRKSGDVYIKNEKVNINSPIDAIKRGIAYVTEDRRREGLFYQCNIITNISISALNKILSILNIINSKTENKIVNRLVEDLHIRMASLSQPALNLSGGNQQKVVLARWLFTNAKIIIFDEPTIGIDVGAKEEIHVLMEKLAKEGNKVVVAICTEIPELVRVADRIVIMKRNGQISEKIDIRDITEKDLRKFIVETGR